MTTHKRRSLARVALAVTVLALAAAAAAGCDSEEGGTGTDAATNDASDGDAATTTTTSSTSMTSTNSTTSSSDASTTSSDVDATSTGDADDMSTAGDASSSSPDTSGPDDADAAGDATGMDTGTVDMAADMSPVVCDFQAVNGLLVMEAESLPLTEEWTTGSDRPGFTGSGFIEWTGSSFNNDPTHGVIQVRVHIPDPGLYRMQWHNRIGMGTNTTEHNDTWVQYPDAAEYYGYRENGGTETRRYPRPICEDTALMASIEALPEVSEATCPNGSTLDGWLKVYSSGANDWRWSTFTSDNDGHDIGIHFEQPGVYTLMLAARADHHLIDRIVIHQRALDDASVRDLSNPETPCP